MTLVCTNRKHRTKVPYWDLATGLSTDNTGICFTDEFSRFEYSVRETYCTIIGVLVSCKSQVAKTPWCENNMNLLQ